MKFSDGVEFDLSGELRVERIYDGLYVVGNNMLMSVSSYQEARDIIGGKNGKSIVGDHARGHGTDDNLHNLDNGDLA